MKPPRVAAFWEWFCSAAPHFGTQFQNEELLGELDHRVVALGDFAWEVGPGLTQPNAFVLSPGGDRKLLALTAAIVAEAPAIDGWEVHSAKPPKQWDLRFEIEDERGNRQLLDASTWQYAMHGEREVEVYGYDLIRLSPAYAKWAAEIALDGILGERERLLRFDEISVEPAPPPHARPLIDLKT